MDSIISLLGFFVIILLVLFVDNIHKISLLDLDLKWKNKLPTLKTK